MKNNVNQLVICKEDYKTVQDWENAIKKAVMVLLDNNYIMTVKWDEKSLGFVAIEYEHDDRSFGCRYPYWLYPEEIESVVWVDELELDK